MKSALRQLVLVVEDHQDTRDLYAEYLSLTGFEVLKARNGMEGFTRACESQPDVIVTDLLLPTIDGWELVRRLRADGCTKDIPIVLVSGWVTASAQETALRVGCASYLTKPCLPQVLVDEIRLVLASQAAAPTAVYGDPNRARVAG